MIVQIVEQAREATMDAKEVHSLTALYDRYAGPVYGYLLRLWGDRPLADELTGGALSSEIRP